MARGRLLTKAIGTSTLWRLSHDHVLLWTCLLPHLDRDGRVLGDPQAVKGLVPFSSWTPEQIEAMLLDFARLHDVSYYEDHRGRRYLQFNAFPDHQHGYSSSGHNYSREPRSEYPPPGECRPVTRTHTPDLPELRVVDHGGR